MCHVLLPPGVNPTVVKYIYHIINFNHLLKFAYGMILCECNHTLFAAGLQGTRQIANITYGVCVQAALGYCSIQWTQNSIDPYSFTVSGDTAGIDPTLLGKYDNAGAQRLVGSGKDVSIRDR
jgi:hypothetical protein